MIPVSKPYLPNRQTLNKYLDGIYERHWLTNNGELVRELTLRLEEYLGVENLLLVANGTLALQIAYRVLGVIDEQNRGKAEAITTPFTFIATASSLKWDGVEPVFVDIDPDNWCIDPILVEGAISERTKAIVPVHVFGQACDVEAIDAISKKHNIPVIYDGCHTFGVDYKGKSILNWGDAATLSFHATKLFHTGEGGAIIFKRKADLERARKMINFGITGPETIDMLGINAKMNELEAAMGLSVLDEMRANLEGRALVWKKYEAALGNRLVLQALDKRITYNYAYFPVVFRDESEVERVSSVLRQNGIMTRRYFCPSLDSLSFLGSGVPLPVSNYIARRILCLPIHSDLDPAVQESIIGLIEAEI